MVQESECDLQNIHINGATPDPIEPYINERRIGITVRFSF